MVFYSFALLAVIDPIELSVILASVLPFYLLLKNFNPLKVYFSMPLDDVASSFELGFGILNVLNTDIQVCL